VTRLALLCCAVTVLCVGLHAQVTPDPKHPQWLRKDGTCFFMCGPGDPEGFLYRGKLNADGTRDGDQMKLIDKLRGTGANCIYLMAVRSHGGDGDRTENPFIDHDPKRPLNAKLLDQWERWFKAMDEAGIVVFFFIYDDSARVWDTGDEVGPWEKTFLEALVGRFKHHDHLIWCVAEEYQERLSAKRVSAIAATLRAADDRKHPIAVHKLNGLSFREFADDPNIDQFAIQYNVKSAAELHDGLVRAFGEAKGRYGLNLSECAPWGAAAEHRAKLWACTMAGAHVMVLGMDIEKTAKEDLEACGHAARFMRAWLHVAPDAVPDDSLRRDDTQYVMTAGKPRRDRHALYGSSVGRGLGVSALDAGNYDLLWLDCVTGRHERTKHRQTADGPATFKPPDGFGPELALMVLREGQGDDPLRLIRKETR